MDEARPVDELWHYTKQAGLEGIIKDLSLRATSATLTNDRQEMLRGEAAVKEGIAAVVPDDELSAIGDLLLIDDECFVTCFTEVADGASMWQHYGQEGYAVVFDRARLEAETSIQDAELMKVVYDETVFQKALRRDLQASLDSPDDEWQGPSLALRHASLKGAEWSSEPFPVAVQV